MSDAFPVSAGVKQGCVLAPILFNVYLVAVTLLAQQNQDARDGGIDFRYRLDGGAFNLSRLRTRTRTSTATVRDLQYADDAAVVAHTAQALQATLNAYGDAYQRVGLKVNSGKTEILQRHTVARGEEEILFLNGVPLKNTTDFKYLSSIIAADGTIDQEITMRIQQACVAFGRLRDRVFLNRNLKISTKITVYIAVCVSTLLYGCETWTVYARHMKSLHRFHMSCLRRMLGINLRDHVTNNEVLNRTGCSSIVAYINHRTLRWTGHLVRMNDDRMPKRLFCGELSEGRRSVGGQRKRFKDHVKRTLKSCQIDSSQLEYLANDRSKWRSVVARGVERMEESERHRRDEQRRRRHEGRRDPLVMALTSAIDATKISKQDQGF